MNEESYRSLGRFLRGEKPAVPEGLAIDGAFRLILEGDRSIAAGLASFLLAIDAKVRRLNDVEADRSQLRAALLQCVGRNSDDVGRLVLDVLEKSDALEPGTPS